MRIDAEKKSREQNDLKNHFVTAPRYAKAHPIRGGLW